ncbi:hypothetical protein CEXT_487941 [Caerostris extrusa]|uniref:Transposase n=1 Tax=Caerostris extrusa TaxID=172846 RepID=A0AAV4XAG4_CAEEX|nr:hypothetical protein CEXT_487941 [Caerostris extrusa]
MFFDIGYDNRKFHTFVANPIDYSTKTVKRDFSPLEVLLGEHTQRKEVEFSLPKSVIMTMRFIYPRVSLRRLFKRSSCNSADMRSVRQQ